MALLGAAAVLGVWHFDDYIDVSSCIGCTVELDPFKALSYQLLMTLLGAAVFVHYKPCLNARWTATGQRFLNNNKEAHRRPKPTPHLPGKNEKAQDVQPSLQVPPTGDGFIPPAATPTDTPVTPGTRLCPPTARLPLLIVPLVVPNIRVPAVSPPVVTLKFVTASANKNIGSRGFQAPEPGVFLAVSTKSCTSMTWTLMDVEKNPG
ncbi:hypothetical protein BDQ17DRAFT_1441236 [Cyathus striatus]|nr:hypothetical protein BDQ17DRAFT_1441236 [Cyathus striatus]